MEYKKERTMTDYTLLRDQLLALAEDVEYEITNLSNALRFYTTAWRGSTGPDFICGGTGPWILGPFQGKPGLYQDPAGRGVCGTAAEKDQTVRWRTSTSFPDILHVTAASNSRS